ncbi:Geranylgeranyl transferase type-2 subunit alpha [Stylophora pistillata]|uniref:Geranylgeranyl transferase type-2 subunit alpha n=1 Tax=Stylophora pistillata TaxID=50429 RepID=A0A2B4S3B1_STYPI|nr:Geranylgeranyl transferase type-2 subunit alpha [Stylophora pistillata]
MHGRIKVRTTAEQAEAKRKEREKKLKIYTETTSRIYQKRKNGEMDKESLSLSEQVLAANPDFSTLWNFRREVFLHKKDESPPEEIQDLCQKELFFLKNCLQVNPKSYGVWYHRQWIMEFMPQPNWKEELQLCNKFLSYDERNFHCWDYRRYTVQKANVSPMDEFNFSTEKIKENFSNYSSWHYRSKLLPLIHPDQSGGSERVEEGALMKEFDLAQNAYFTDPYDQSAWFYHRWLLGREMGYLELICQMGRSELTAVHSSVLQQELESCRLLLEEEPDNKCKYSIRLRDDANNGFVDACIESAFARKGNGGLFGKTYPGGLLQEGVLQRSSEHFEKEDFSKSHASSVPTIFSFSEQKTKRKAPKKRRSIDDDFPAKMLRSTLV